MPTIREIESQYPFIAIPAGLKNLSTASQLAYKSDHKRNIKRIRQAYKEHGGWPSADYVKTIAI